MWSRLTWFSVVAWYFRARRSRSGNLIARTEPCRTVAPPTRAYFGITSTCIQQSDTDLGRDVGEESIREFLQRVRPLVQDACAGVPVIPDILINWWPAPGIGAGLVGGSAERHARRGRGDRRSIIAASENEPVVEHHPDWAGDHGQGQLEKRTSIFSLFWINR